MSRRTIVIFHLPSNALVYLELADLVTTPIAGANYTLEGARYQVTDVLESIGEFKDSAQRSGMHKLLEMLALRFDNDSISLLAQLRNIGSGDPPTVGPGGIILPTKHLIGDFDHAVLVSVKELGKKRVAGTLLGQLQTFAVHGHTGEDSDSNKGAHSSAPPTRVGEDAAG